MQMFDFNAIQQPTWPIKLADDNQTVVRLSYPSLELADRLVAMSESMREVVNKRDGTAIKNAFSVVAAVMSCNEDGLTFTAEELRDKYRMTLLGMAQFTAGYMTFLKEANNAGN